jgi:quercetin dioxygenase-like cupin family protein
MSFVDVDKLKVTERLPGWRGRYFHVVKMTGAHYEFTRGASIHEHHHPQAELYEALEGELELTVDGVTHVARPCVAAIVPSNARHSVRALIDGRAIIVDSPARPEFG